MTSPTSAPPSADFIELLGPEVLDRYRPLVRQFEDVRGRLHLGLGWHYLLDLAWSAAQLQPKRGDLVLDAGSGLGIMQWWLSEQGANVLGVDLRDRANLDRRFREWAPVRGLRPQDLNPLPTPGPLAFFPSWRPWRWHRWPGKVRDALRDARRPSPPSGRGVVTIYTQDLSRLRDVRDESVDGIVSISALEHNTPEGLRACVVELMRVLKPGGKLVATLGAGKDADWFHKPSQGWCYTDASLRDIFALPAAAPSNYARFSEIFEALRNSRELQDKLDPDYKTSGDNGMPWGVWDPQYLTVGVVKTKPK